MIVGIGVDIVDITRFGSTLARVPGLAERLLVDSEALAQRQLSGCPLRSQALAKALGSPGSLSWHDALDCGWWRRAAQFRDGGCRQGTLRENWRHPYPRIPVARRRSGHSVCGGRSGMIPAYTSGAIREAEAPLLAAGVDLMGQAAFALAHHVQQCLPHGGRVGLLVGPGNNGGDALFAGAALRMRRGIGVEAVLFGEPHLAGLDAFVTAGGRVVTMVGENRAWLGDAIADIFASDVILDGLLGIGSTGPLREPMATFVSILADLLAADHFDSRPRVIAVDVPRRDWRGRRIVAGTVPASRHHRDVWRAQGRAVSPARGGRSGCHCAG